MGDTETDCEKERQRNAVTQMGLWEIQQKDRVRRKICSDTNGFMAKDTAKKTVRRKICSDTNEFMGDTE
jgi:hypothetical protein